MQQILSFIANLENDKDKNIKIYHKMMAGIFWNFGCKIAENFFIYGDSAIDYAKDILFMTLHADIETVLQHIKQEHTKYDVAYDESCIYDLFIQAYKTSLESLEKHKHKDFYI